MINKEDVFRFIDESKDIDLLHQIQQKISNQVKSLIENDNSASMIEKIHELYSHWGDVVKWAYIEDILPG